MDSNLFLLKIKLHSVKIKKKTKTIKRIKSEHHAWANKVLVSVVIDHVIFVVFRFRLSTHPSHNLIARYTEELNNMPYRRKFPKLETKNVQFWFKNRRAKNKRLNYLEINK